MAPPAPGDKEKKKRLYGPLAGKIANGFHGITELNDYVKAIYSGMGGPKGNKTPQDKLRWIYDNYDKIDEPGVFRNIMMELLKNEMGDYAIGRTIGKIKGTGPKGFGDHGDGINRAAWRY